MAKQSFIPKSEIESAGVAQLVRASAFQAEGHGFESRLPLYCCRAHVAQAVEHILGKDVVGGSSPPVGSRVFGSFSLIFIAISPTLREKYC